MIKIDEAVIVEGKYDKIKLSGIIDGLIIETNGFRIFSDKKKLNLIRHLAVKSGIIIMTDSDAAGFLIRNYIVSSISEGKIFHAYVPEIMGKEKRKEKASKEGKLGVEGINSEIIENSIKQAGILNKQFEKGLAKKSDSEKFKDIKLKLYKLGYYAGKASKEKRDKLKKKLQLPAYLSTNALIEVLSKCFTTEDLESILAENGDHSYYDLKQSEQSRNKHKR